MCCDIQNMAQLLAVKKSLENFNENFVIKPKQFTAIFNILKEKDTLCILPTSYGKSLIFNFFQLFVTIIVVYNNNNV